MKRRLLNLLTVVSLLLCVAVAVLWVRSYWATARFEWWSVGTGGYEFRVHGVYTRAGNLGFYVGDYPPGLSRSGVYELLYHRDRIGRTSPPAVGTAGFAVVRSAPAPGQVDVAWCELRVPYWPLLLVFGVAPVRRTARAMSGARFHRMGLCRRCGYDLRATPGRCPECGHEPSPVGNLSEV
jgi:hypothetical protein